MRTRVLFVGLMCAASFAASCGEVDNCEIGEIGCKGGLSDDLGQCRFGLVRDPSTDMCVESSDDDGGVTPPIDPNEKCLGGCKTGEACRTDGTCVNVCEQTGAIASGPSLPTCRPPAGTAAYDFQKAAIALCTQECVRRAAFCGTGCNPAECTGPAAVALAMLRCPGGMVECAMSRCEAVRDTPCAQQMCPNNAAPNCANVTCSDNCREGTESLNFDGVCDDGDLANAVSAICPWGSDCGDCGPRRGPAPAKVKQIGEQCIDPYQCGAPYDDFSNVPGWCVVVDRTTEIERCVPDCSISETCPAGYSCQALTFAESGGGSMTLTDSSGVVGSACFPMLCGN